MRFYFDSLSDFIYMSGHGPYVWSCYGLVAAILIYLAIAPSLKKRRFLREQRRLMERLAVRQSEPVSFSSE